jgi:polyhydroxybutyrate depolymerase
VACSRTPSSAAEAGGQATLPATGASGNTGATPVAGGGTGVNSGAAGGAGAQPASAGRAGAAGSSGGETAAAGSGQTIAGSSATAGGGGPTAGSNTAGASVPIAGSAAPATCPATSTLKSGETNETIMVGSTMRNYLLHVPQSYTGKTPVPLVIDWHGLLTDASLQKGVSGYLALSDQEGFILAYPNGIDAAWNVGPCCTSSRDVDDLGFSKALLAAIESRGCVDPKRVYSTGFSLGGGMSLYLACNSADTYAAIVPSAFDLLTEDEEPCHPSRPISVMAFRGTGDFIVPYAGGASMPPNGLQVTIHFLGAMGTFQRWSQLNGCTGMPTDTGAGCQTYSQCKDGVEVTLCTKQGGSHEPGDAKLGWSFMKKHPLP